MHSASALIGVATANMLPNFTINANGGYTATTLAGLISPINAAWLLSGNITQTIFDGASLLHLRREAEANYDQTAWGYRNVVITALREKPRGRVVVAAGGVNHRSGLYDMVLVKDNHLAALGGLSGFADQIRRLRKERPNVRIEVEADDLEQARAFVEIEGIDVILLDNMEPAQIREALALRRNNIKFEASGGITLKNVRRIAATGVDYISIGALTNAARAIDLGLEMAHVHG